MGAKLLSFVCRLFICDGDTTPRDTPHTANGRRRSCRRRRSRWINRWGYCVLETSVGDRDRGSLQGIHKVCYIITWRVQMGFYFKIQLFIDSPSSICSFPPHCRFLFVTLMAPSLAIIRTEHPTKEIHSVLVVVYRSTPRYSRLNVGDWSGGVEDIGYNNALQNMWGLSGKTSLFSCFAWLWRHRPLFVAQLLL